MQDKILTLKASREKELQEVLQKLAETEKLKAELTTRGVQIQGSIKDLELLLKPENGN